MSRRRVVITGAGAITPLGAGAARLHERWSAGECGIEDGEGACSDFDPGQVLSRKEIRRSDRFTQLALGACAEAVEQAGWGEQLPYEPERVGCILGTGIGGLGTIESQHSVMLDQGSKAISPLGVPLFMPNAGAAAVAMRYGLRGPLYGTVSACASSAHSVGLAARTIQYGEADAVIVGGAEATLTEFAHGSFAAMQALSPSGICRPFDVRRDGFVMGEGAGVLVLEAAEAAQARGAQVLGELLGYAATSDAYHLTAPEPEGRPGARAVELALADAEITPGDVDYVNAHGTSTPLNDASETRTLKLALGDQRAHEVPISSTKSAIGHLLGAAGAVEAIATLLALRARVAPPTVGYEQPDPELDLDYVPGSARALAGFNGSNGGGGRERAIGISNSFGFGGHNVVLCLAA